MSEKIEKNDVGNENKPLDMMQVSPELVAEISNALRNLDNAQIDYLLEPLHSADVADIFEQLHG